MACDGCCVVACYVAVDSSIAFPKVGARWTTGYQSILVRIHSLLKYPIAPGPLACGRAWNRATPASSVQAPDCQRCQTWISWTARLAKHRAGVGREVPWLSYPEARRYLFSFKISLIHCWSCEPAIEDLQPLEKANSTHGTKCWRKGQRMGNTQIG